MQEQQPQITKQVQSLLSQSYRSLGKIRITFKFLHVFLKQIQKTQLFLDGHIKLIQVKKRIDQLSKKSFIFFLRQSFIPSLDAKVGDLAINYGRVQVDAEGNKKYQLTLTASQNATQYG